MGQTRRFTTTIILAVVTSGLGIKLAAQQTPAAPQAAPKSSEPAKPATKDQPAPKTTTPATALSIALAPDKLDFGQQMVGFPSVVQTITVTATPLAASAATPAPSVKITAKVTGEFKVDPGACQAELHAGEHCVLTVTFSPAQTHTTTASLVVTTDPPSTPQTALFSGEGVGSCPSAQSFFTKDGLKAFAPALMVVLLYLLGILLVRWNMVAIPNKKLVQAQIEAVRAEASSLLPDPQHPQTLPQIMALLGMAEAPFLNKKRNRDYLADYVFWTRGEEIAAWGYVHEAEELMVDLLPADRVQARMETAEQQLRQVSSSTASALADRIHEVVAPAQGQAPPSLARCQALLHEALGIIYDNADKDYIGFMSWQNKAVWLTGCGLLFIATLAAVLQHGVLLLVGAVGGLLSRLSRSLQRADVPTDYGASWTTLFLSPVVGALAGWSGVLLVTLAVQLNVLGPLFKIDWCNPWSPLTLGIAFLLGFSERAFDGILSQLESKVQGTLTTPPPSPSPGASPSPKLISLSPTSGPAAGGTQLTLTGTDFSAGPKVNFGGVAATAVTLVSKTTITATTPPHAVGSVDVEVVNADGQRSSLRSSYQYV